VCSILLDGRDELAAETAVIFSYSDALSHDAGYMTRLGAATLDAMTDAVERGGIDAGASTISALQAILAERALAAEGLFPFIYLLERAALDRLALDDDTGASTEAWPFIAQAVRRASFDLAAALGARAAATATPRIVDSATSLYTRDLFDLVLAKETDRASRYGYRMALILFELDPVARGGESKDLTLRVRIVERLGALVRQYFRQHDWVARYGATSVAVLLTRSDAEHASRLAADVRATVEERFGFVDHRTNEAVAVTVSGAVLDVPGLIGMLVDPERLCLEADSLLSAARQAGGNRIEEKRWSSTVSRTLPRSSPSA
jgi:diguanylate cyclase (GGDEF)-like protein